MKKTIMRLFGALMFAAAMVGCTQIDTGNVGLQSVRGQVKQEVLQAGLVFSPVTTVTEVCGTELPLSMSDLKPQTSDKIALFDLDVDFYYQIDAGKVPTLATKWPGDKTEIKGEGCVRLGNNYVTRQAREAIYNVVSTLNSATIHTERTKIASEAVKALQANLDAEAGKGLFFVRSANIRNLETDPVLKKNIDAAANRQFEINAKAKEVELAKLEAERARAEAQGVADAIRIKAEAVSKNGGAEYVQLEAIKKWNGVLPTVASGAVPFVNLTQPK